LVDINKQTLSLLCHGFTKDSYS